MRKVLGIFGILVFSSINAATVYKSVYAYGKVNDSDVNNPPNNDAQPSPKDILLHFAPQKIVPAIKKGMVDSNNKFNINTQDVQLIDSSINAKSSVSRSLDTSTIPSLDQNMLFHHHIFNFYFNDSDKSKYNYLVMQNHAIAMSYDSTVHYLVKRLPANLDGLKRILLHNSYYIPAAFDFAKHQVKYTASYLDVNNKSTVNPDRIVWNSYPLNSRDIDILKGYGCASSDNYASISTNATLSDAKRLFRINNDYERVIVNWQSRFVVDDLAKKTIQSLSTKNYDYLYLDDLSRNPADCVNKGYGGKGSYISWKEGQLAFLQKVTTAAHAMTGRQGGQIKVFGNLWSPYASPDIVKWYTDKKLRLDHYYFESAGYATADLLHGQVANGIDPETGLPAFEPLAGVFIPANLVSLCTRNEHMIALSSSAASQGKLNDYLSEHFDVAGVAASQGSWFGWVGETSLDQLGFDGKLIHSNAMQLLRAIPNWENLAKVPLSSRRFNKFNNVYVSPNSNFNNEVVQGHNPINNEIYVVFMTIAGRADIKVKNIATASFVNSYFNKTGEDALPCLLDFNDKAILKCVDKVGNGIRITLK